MTFWIFFLLFCFLVGAFAKHTGRSVGLWFFIAFFTSPVIGGVLLLIILLMNGKVKTESAPTGKMFRTFEEALNFTRDNYDLDAGEDYAIASKLLKQAVDRNDCDRIALSHIN